MSHTYLLGFLLFTYILFELIGANVPEWDILEVYVISKCARIKYFTNICYFKIYGTTRRV